MQCKGMSPSPNPVLTIYVAASCKYHIEETPKPLTHYYDSYTGSMLGVGLMGIIHSHVEFYMDSVSERRSWMALSVTRSAYCGSIWI